MMRQPPGLEERTPIMIGLSIPWLREGMSFIDEFESSCVQSDKVSYVFPDFEGTNANASSGSQTVSFDLDSLAYGPSLFHHAEEEPLIEVTKTKKPAGGQPGTQPGIFSSLGAREHVYGTCKPCAWVWKEVGCKNGSDCEFCHSCLPGDLKQKRRHKTLMIKMNERRRAKAAANSQVASV
eukprot:TRINITY_DN12981_c0_g1_i2.p1 TRINITY_DN12981_c0_g1~~TRINITY_DN12981_c0_g1_i2.p1  ORF type:complete len:180 (+),score=26.84 TRINITY_DN12981_c0_g1_i2:166-705(+)